MKKYNLSEGEKQNIDSRQALIKQYQYIIHVINADIQAYMDNVVLPRLSVKTGDKYQLSPDNKFVTITKEEDEPSTDKK